MALQIDSFKPIQLHIDKVGPYREDTPYRFDFTGNDDKTPCNLFAIMSKNGMGKTTALEMMAGIMALLSPDNQHTLGHKDVDDGNGQVQLDILVTYALEGVTSKTILTLSAAKRKNQSLISDIDAYKLAHFDAEDWSRIGFYWGNLYGSGQKVISSIPEGKLSKALLAAVQSQLNKDDGAFTDNSSANMPNQFLPTLLYFSAYRDIPPLAENEERAIGKPLHWGYQPCYRFDPHAKSWVESLDNLMVWLTWLDDGRIDKALKLVNTSVFDDSDKEIDGVQKNNLETRVKTDSGGSHTLSELSSGEKNMVQHFLRVGSLMTSNTILLIDEFDIHLHIRWQYKMLYALNKLIKNNPNITIMVTTHSPEMVKHLSNMLDIPPEGVIFGGNLIDNDIIIDE